MPAASPLGMSPQGKINAMVNQPSPATAEGVNATGKGKKDLGQPKAKIPSAPPPPDESYYDKKKRQLKEWGKQKVLDYAMSKVAGDPEGQPGSSMQRDKKPPQAPIAKNPQSQTPQHRAHRDPTPKVQRPQPMGPKLGKLPQPHIPKIQPLRR